MRSLGRLVMVTVGSWAPAASLAMFLLLPFGGQAGAEWDRPEVIGVEIVATNAGRVDWSPDGGSMAFDRQGDDGFFDVWISDADGERCLTCDHARLGLPAGHKGNPAYHPSDAWLVIQVEQPDHPGPQGASIASPGAGAYNDLWWIRSDGSAAGELVHHDLSTPRRGSLHPHIDPTGRWLTWAQFVRGQGQPFDAIEEPSTLINDRVLNSTSGEWEIALAEMQSVDAVPVLGPVGTFQPGGPAFFETHDLLPDGRRILFSNNPDRYQQVGAMDVLELDTADGTISRRITQTDDGWEEHAHYGDETGGRITYAAGSLAPHDDYPYPGPPVAQAAFVAAPQLDLWVAEPDEDQWRLTFFANDDWAHHFEGSQGASVVDNSISPDGTRIAALVLTRSIGPVLRRSTFQPLVVIRLSEPL